MSHDHSDVKKGSQEFRERTSPRSTVMAPSMEEMTEHYTKFPNTWSHVRYRFKELFAEFFGTMILVLFGDGVVCQVRLLF